MADFEQRGELPALVCGASGKEITFAGKFQPKKTGSKLLCLSKNIIPAGMKSLSRQFGSGLLNLGLAAGDKVAVIAPNCPEVLSLCLHFEAYWVLHMYYVLNNFVKNLSTWPIIILF